MFERYCKVTGNAYERGAQLGERLSERILANYNNLVALWRGRGYDYEEWRALVVARYEALMREWTPEVLEQLRGMADGAGIPFDQVLAVTCYYEKSFDVDTVAVADKCTSFLASGRATRDGKVILAQTNDEDLVEMLWELDVTEHHVDPATGREALVYTHPGVPAMMGMNNRGLAVLWTYIDNGQLGHGVPTTAIIRHVLECDSADEALGFLRAVPHDVPNEFGIGDKSGTMYCVECFPNAVHVGAEPDLMVHTNHNVYSPEEEEASVSPTTRYRFANMRRLCEESFGRIDAELAREFLRFHDDEDIRGNICVHPRAGAPWRVSMASMVFELSDGRMSIAHGPACENEFRSYEFERYL